MKKSLLALAVLGAFAGAASAQSSVTIYGNIQLGIQKTSGTDPLMDVAPGYNQIGFKGNEQITPDLSGIFDLQLRFSPESGGNDGSFNGSGAAPDQNRGPFQGKSILGLSSKSMGTLTVGRQLTPVNVYEANGDPMAMSMLPGAGSTLQGSLDVLGLGWYSDPTPGGVRSNAGLARTDMIYYASPKLAGMFTATYAYGLKRSAASGTILQQNKSFNSLVVNFATGPVYVGLGAEQNRRGDKWRFINGSYDLQVVKLYAGYATVDTTGPAVLAGANAIAPLTPGVSVVLPAGIAGSKSKRAQAGLSVPVGQWTFAAGYGQIKSEGTGNKQVNKIGVAAQYALSSRTFVATSYKQDKNKDTITSVYGVAAGTTQKGVDVQLRHLF